MDFLAIDPGNSAGWATFTYGKLKACGGWRDYVGPRLDVARVLIEMPMIYPHDPVPPSNILTLARGVGRFVERYDGVPIDFVYPRDWKGQLKKHIHHPRILAALDDKEAEVVFKAGLTVGKGLPDMMDAIGLGAWAVSTKKWTW